MQEFDPASEVGTNSVLAKFYICKHYTNKKKIHFQVRAVIEGQFLSMRAHAERFGMPIPPKRIIATGGASANLSILNLVASIFGCDVYTVQRPGMQFFAVLLFEWVSFPSRKLLYQSYYHLMKKPFTCLADSASLGAALRAAHGWMCSKKGSFVPIASLYKDKLEMSALNCKLSVSAWSQELTSKYALLMKKRIEIENQLVQKLGRCWSRSCHSHTVMPRSWSLEMLNNCEPQKETNYNSFWS